MATEGSGRALLMSSENTSRRWRVCLPVVHLLPPELNAATRSTRCYPVNVNMPEITQRDLRSKSREIMDAVEHGQGFTVTRDGHQIGELIPIRRRRRFVSRQEFAAMSRNAPVSDLDAFRADQDATADHEDGDPYDG